MLKKVFRLGFSQGQATSMLANEQFGQHMICDPHGASSLSAARERSGHLLKGVPESGPCDSACTTQHRAWLLGFRVVRFQCLRQ